MSAPSRSATVIICIDRTNQKLSNRKETKGINNFLQIWAYSSESQYQIGQIMFEREVWYVSSSDRYRMKSVINWLLQGYIVYHNWKPSYRQHKIRFYIPYFLKEYRILMRSDLSFLIWQDDSVIQLFMVTSFNSKSKICSLYINKFRICLLFPHHLMADYFSGQKKKTIKSGACSFR